MQKRWINKNRKTIKKVLYIKERDEEKKYSVKLNNIINQMEETLAQYVCFTECVMYEHR